MFTCISSRRIGAIITLGVGLLLGGCAAPVGERSDATDTETSTLSQALPVVDGTGAAAPVAFPAFEGLDFEALGFTGFGGLGFEGPGFEGLGFGGVTAAAAEEAAAGGFGGLGFDGVAIPAFDGVAIPAFDGVAIPAFDGVAIPAFDGLAIPAFDGLGFGGLGVAAGEGAVAAGECVGPCP
jgi:hypothetical protein